MGNLNCIEEMCIFVFEKLIICDITKTDKFDTFNKKELLAGEKHD